MLRKRKKPPAKKREGGGSSAVYVTSIPLDATFEDINEVFSKYGLIAESADTEQKRIKMYTDENGKFKGEALIIYYRPESVQLAIDMLDDTPFNYKQGPNGNMKVLVADASFKKQKEGDGNGNQPKQAKRYQPDKQKLEAKKKEMQQYAPQLFPEYTT